MGGCQPYVNMENLACYSLVGEKTAPCSVGFSRFGVSTSMYATASLLRCAIGGVYLCSLRPTRKKKNANGASKTPPTIFLRVCLIRFIPPWCRDGRKQSSAPEAYAKNVLGHVQLLLEVVDHFLQGRGNATTSGEAGTPTPHRRHCTAAQQAFCLAWFRAVLRLTHTQATPHRVLIGTAPPLNPASTVTRTPAWLPLTHCCVETCGAIYTTREISALSIPSPLHLLAGGRRQWQWAVAVLQKMSLKVWNQKLVPVR